MSKDLSDWGDPSKNGKQSIRSWNSVWKAIVSVAGLILMYYEAIIDPDPQLMFVVAALAMMGYPVVRWLDKM